MNNPTNSTTLPTSNPLILAVDTSCDDTSASVMRGRVILSNVIASQTQLHKQYGGVFPTVAKQAHKENILPTIQAALKKAKLPGNKKITWQDLSALAVTVGPGLAPALEVGIKAMKILAKEKDLPLIAVNHIEGHTLSAIALHNKKGKRRIKSIIKDKFKIECNSKIEQKSKNTLNNFEQKPQLGIITNDSYIQKTNKKQNIQPKTSAQQTTSINKINYPVLAVVVSGGHTQFIYFEKIGDYKILGSTIDDAAGECLDKIGRMLNLGYPAGATIEKFAKLGDYTKIKFPLPMTTTKTFDMSFSGLKTFARNTIQKLTEEKEMSKQDIYDFCASAQYGVFRHITYKLNKLLLEVPVNEIWLGGGVAQNIYLRQTIRETIKNFEKNENEKFDFGVNKDKFESNKNAINLNQKNNNKQIEKQNFTTPKKITFRFPFTKRLCMDNAAMIGLVANFKFKRKEFITDLDNLDRKPRWKIGKNL